MSACDELPECPLCMEMFEIDDLNFFPCTCGYQICRFCWHRIRTNENGLCPACRKAYPEDPAQFKPLTDDEVHKIKKDRRQKETQRKQKSAESRKHLANVRVVQKNLVFVVGLSARLTDPDTLKRHEYFGKFGKIHKVVINQSTSYVGSQGPSASAYVTYVRPEDALGSIRVVNNLQIDGRTLKASLGTTKYCSHFLKGTQCLKTDCMYLHDYGDELASFTKEDIQQGKHLQYEQKLHEQYSSPGPTPPSPGPTLSTGSSADVPILKPNNSCSNQSGVIANDNLPSSGELSPDVLCAPSVLTDSQTLAPPLGSPGEMTASANTRLATGDVGSAAQIEADLLSLRSSSSVQSSDSPLLPNGGTTEISFADSSSSVPNGDGPHQQQLVSVRSMPISMDGGSVQQLLQRTASTGISNAARLHALSLGGAGRPTLFGGSSTTEHLSLFSDTGFPTNRSVRPVQQPTEESLTPLAEPQILETMSVKSSTNWTEAFGFPSDNDAQDDDLGFDPWDVSARGLADMIENERVSSSSQFLKQTNVASSPQQPPSQMNGFFVPPPHMTAPPQFNSYHAGLWSKVLPPGFNLNGYMPSMHAGVNHPQYMPLPPMRSKMMNLMQVQPPPPPPLNHVAPPPNTYSSNQSEMFYCPQPPTHLKPEHPGSTGYHQHMRPSINPSTDDYEWQEGLRALLPNINISFASQNAQQQQQQLQQNNGGGGGAGHLIGAGGAGLPLNGSMPSQPLSRAFQSMDKRKLSDWCSSSHSMPDLSFDPAIVNLGGVTEDAPGEEPPHWMASLHHLTEDQHTFMHPTHQQMPSWMPASVPVPPTGRYPPPGFPITMARQNSEPQNFSTEHKLPSS